MNELPTTLLQTLPKFQSVPNLGFSFDVLLGGEPVEIGVIPGGERRRGGAAVNCVRLLQSVYFWRVLVLLLLLQLVFTCTSTGSKKRKRDPKLSRGFFAGRFDGRRQGPAEDGDGDEEWRERLAWKKSTMSTNFGGKSGGRGWRQAKLEVDAGFWGYFWYLTKNEAYVGRLLQWVNLDR